MKIGLFFGSFNPVHQGHMILANYMLSFAGLDELWFVVSPHNPLKDKQILLHAFDRLKLLEKAIGKYRYFTACDIELYLPQPSYTIDTLVRLSERYPTHDFVLILGTDTLETLHKWKNYKQILHSYQLLVYPRKDADGGKLINHPHVKLFEAPEIELSSSFIRESIRNETDVRFMLPHGVYDEIIKKQFYKY
ncbi:MAG: nicotinate (nicotinamide) nucleotide adenylyltransferase [Bacteroidales bacterium]|jgi:nicotinate-nucleotide adenylyltransferase|nr:nicotinate (nicotinamide) nucleotide adenylyltransferase [Bacteroidales bacterium]MCK9449522.1 nicotinate (nicotinamide) nucleotide adenylyltransferase [Bacteroidales bacterium]MDD3700396.1 nicotinate (nicotinamide) nucleotide adenylyltransferase [Bacteroidales bacterium]MDY0368718.1 nicotinate (nicotinamide) nucleotide adenylyltransferase [Bacteroidales bacterium]